MKLASLIAAWSARERSEKAAPEPPAWQAWYPAPLGEWVLFRSFKCAATAQWLAAVLRAENVPAYVDPQGGAYWFPIADHHLFVEARMVHRARWLLEQNSLSDAELSYLATAKSPGAQDVARPSQEPPVPVVYDALHGVRWSPNKALAAVGPLSRPAAEPQQR